MAFGGNAGAAGGQLAAATMFSPVAGADVGAYDANDNLVFRDAANTENVVGQGGGRLQQLMIDISGTALSAFVDATVDGSAADTGVLTTTGASLANQHNLPANLGPGRGNWTANDLARLVVQLRATELAVPALNVGNVYIDDVVLAGGNITIVVKNVSGSALTSVELRLDYQHSLEV